MSTAEILKFENSVVDDLIFRFNMNQKNAIEAVKQSVLQKLLHKYPENVLHYPIETWSDDVWREYNHLPFED